MSPHLSPPPAAHLGTLHFIPPNLSAFEPTKKPPHKPNQHPPLDRRPLRHPPLNHLPPFHRPRSSPNLDPRHSLPRLRGKQLGDLEYCPGCLRHSQDRGVFPLPTAGERGEGKGESGAHGPFDRVSGLHGVLRWRELLPPPSRRGGDSASSGLRSRGAGECDVGNCFAGSEPSSAENVRGRTGGRWIA